jgi:hypothetical protein
VAVLAPTSPPEAEDRRGRTALLRAAEHPTASDEACAAVVTVLLAEGAQPQHADRAGRTALHWAAARGRPATASLLLNHGALPTVTDAVGRTPLHCAAACGSDPDYAAVDGVAAGRVDEAVWVAVATALLHAGSNAQVADSTQRTPLGIARAVGAVHLAGLLDAAVARQTPGGQADSQSEPGAAAVAFPSLTDAPRGSPLLLPRTVSHLSTGSPELHRPSPERDPRAAATAAAEAELAAMDRRIAAGQENFVTERERMLRALTRAKADLATARQASKEAADRLAAERAAVCQSSGCRSLAERGCR